MLGQEQLHQLARCADHRIVAGGQLEHLPAWLLAHPDAGGGNRGQGGPCAVDESARQGSHPIGVKIQRLQVGPKGLRRLAPVHPVAVAAFESEQAGIGRRQTQATAGGGGIDAALAGFRAVGTAPALARKRHRSIQIDQARQHTRAFLLQTVGHTGDDHASIAVAHQHHAPQLFGLDQADHVLDVGMQVHPGAEQVGTLPHAGQRDGVRIDASPAQQRQHAPPAPGTVPGAVDQHQRGTRQVIGCRHRFSPGQ